MACESCGNEDEADCIPVIPHFMCVTGACAAIVDAIEYIRHETGASIEEICADIEQTYKETHT